MLKWCQWFGKIQFLNVSPITKTYNPKSKMTKKVN